MGDCLPLEGLHTVAVEELFSLSSSKDNMWWPVCNPHFPFPHTTEGEEVQLEKVREVGEGILRFFLLFITLLWFKSPRWVCFACESILCVIPAPYLNSVSQPFLYFLSPLALWRGVVEHLWWVPGIQPESTLYATYATQIEIIYDRKDLLNVNK